MKIVINRSINNQYFFKIIAENNFTLAHSETYLNKTDCISTANLIKNYASSARIVDESQRFSL